MTPKQLFTKAHLERIKREGVAISQVERNFGVERGYFKQIVESEEEDVPQHVLVALSLLCKGNIKENLEKLKQFWATPTDQLGEFFKQ